jgi:hypothetical protein
LPVGYFHFNWVLGDLDVLERSVEGEIVSGRT